MQSRWMQRRNEVTGENEYFYPIAHKDALIGINELYGTHNKPTADDVGALSINGGTLTGDLYVGSGYGIINMSTTNLLLGSLNTQKNLGNGRFLELRNSNNAGAPELNKAISLTTAENGSWKTYHLYGEHNKPTTADIKNAYYGDGGGTGGSAGYVVFAKLKVLDTYADRPIVFELGVRSKNLPTYVSVKFTNLNGYDPDIESLTYWGSNINIFAQKIETGTWLLYHEKSSTWGSVTVTGVKNAEDRVQITYPDIYVATKPTDNIKNCSGTTGLITSTLPVSQGGTGTTTFTSGAVLIGNGTNAITTRSITHNTSKTDAGTSSNLATCGTVTYGINNRLNRTSLIYEADTNYTTHMARAFALSTSVPSSLTNGTCTLVYA